MRMMLGDWILDVENPKIIVLFMRRGSYDERMLTAFADSNCVIVHSKCSFMQLAYSSILYGLGSN
jgi:hypothetical protein